MLSLLELDSVSSCRTASFGSASALQGAFCLVESCVEPSAAHLLVFLGL